MTHRARIAAVSCVIVLAAGCGGGGDEAPEPEPTATEESPAAEATEPEPEPTPEAVSLDGTPAPEALSGFRCEETDDGWISSGFIANDTDKAADFQVTVYIGPGDGTARDGVTKLLPAVAPAGSVEFSFEDVAGEGAECHVQVLRTQ